MPLITGRRWSSTTNTTMINSTLAMTLFLAALAGPLAAAAKGPVQVFILSGQSNMQGKAAAYTLDAVIDEPKTRDQFRHLKKDGEWVKRDDVWVTFLDNPGRGGFPKYGPLTVGYGSEKTVRDENNQKIPVPGVGPELGIGHVLGDHYDEQVLLIKAAWGGRAVKYTFRPPSAMPSDAEIRAQVVEIENKRQAKLEKYEADKAAGKKKLKPAGPEHSFEEHKAGYGSDYRKVLSETRMVLDDIKKYFPDYDAEQGYEISGFIWFQGWNDAIGEGNPDYVDQMAHFIRDMRKDLKAPKMPFVIGELGTDGPGAEGWVATFRKQQAEIAALPEFKGSVALARTAGCWPTGLPDMQDKWDAFKAEGKKNEAKPKDDPTRMDPGAFFNKNWLQKYKKELSYTSDKRYHYLGSGACYYKMGESMGKAMAELVKKN
jgi:alpha-galactosidase